MADEVRVTEASQERRAMLVKINGLAPGSGATDIGKAEDAAHTSGDVGIMLLGVRQDGTPVALAGDGDYIPLTLDANGLLNVGPDCLALSGSVTSAAVLFTQDCVGYESISVQVTSAGSSCTITYETSDDNSNWLSAGGLSSASIGAGAPTATSSTTGVRVFPKYGRYFRARVSTYGSGTVTVVGNLHKNPQPLTNRISVDGAITQGSAVGNTNISVAVTSQTANPTAVGNGTNVRAIATAIGAQIVKPFSIPEADVSTGATPVTVTTSDQAVLAAGAAGIRNYATWALITTNATWTANTIQIRSATTVILEFDLPAGAGVYRFDFPSPIKTAAAAAMNVLATGAVTGTCKVNVGGYQAV